MIDSYTVGLLFTGLLMFVGHWFPWPVKLPRLGAYVYGVFAILVGQAVWLLPLPNAGGGALLWARVAAFAIAGGAATGLAYFVDWVLNLWARSKAHERTHVE